MRMLDEMRDKQKALIEALARAESESAALRAEKDEWRAMYTATLARAEAAEQALSQSNALLVGQRALAEELAAECAGLRTELSAALSDLRTRNRDSLEKLDESEALRADLSNAGYELNKALTEAASLRAEVERLNKFVDICSEVHNHNVKLKSRIATANALLERCKRYVPNGSLNDDMRAHLAAQPATVKR